MFPGPAKTVKDLDRVRKRLVPALRHQLHVRLCHMLYFSVPHTCGAYFNVEGVWFSYKGLEHGAWIDELEVAITIGPEGVVSGSFRISVENVDSDDPFRSRLDFGLFLQTRNRNPSLAHLDVSLLSTTTKLLYDLTFHEQHRN